MTDLLENDVEDQDRFQYPEDYHIMNNISMEAKSQIVRIQTRIVRRQTILVPLQCASTSQFVPLREICVCIRTSTCLYTNNLFLRRGAFVEEQNLT